MKNKNQLALFQLLGLPEGLPFVLFCSLLGSLVSEASMLSTIALSFTANLAIYCFAQVYKHISNAPEDALAPSKADPNPISYGMVGLRPARFALFSALLIGVISSFLLSSINIVLAFSSILLTMALFHPNIRFSNHLLLGFNQHHWIYGGIFLLSSIFANRTHPEVIEFLFPLLFITSLYLLFRLEESRTELPQSQAAAFWRILFASIALVAAAVTFILLKPVPFWTVALWVFLTAVQLSINFSSRSESSLHQPLYLFKVFEISGAASFLVYLIFVFINTLMS